MLIVGIVGIGGRISCADTAEGALKLLVKPLTLALGLGMKTRHQLDSGHTEILPHPEYKLWSSVREYLSGDPVQSEDVDTKELGSLDSGR